MVELRDVRRVGVVLAMIVLIGVLASHDYRAVGAEGWVRRVQLS